MSVPSNLLHFLRRTISLVTKSFMQSQMRLYLTLFDDKCANVDTPQPVHQDNYRSIHLFPARYVVITFAFPNPTVIVHLIQLYAPAAGDPISVSRVEWLVVESSVL